jgi:hypothetical protein
MAGLTRVFCAASLVLVVAIPALALGGPGEITLRQSAPSVAAYDFVEVTLGLVATDVKNPFTDATVEGRFGKREESQPMKVLGFCDSSDGRTYRVRFMPSTPGDYEYSVTYRHGGDETTLRGTFQATDGHRRGLVRVDPEHPWHFIWEGTREHYFLNGTTAFMLMGWRDEAVSREILDRFARFKTNRVRVLLNGRSDHFWTESVKVAEGFTTCVNPWVAKRPDDPLNPGFDFARFNLGSWARFERMLRHARDRDIIVSVVMDWADSRVHPAAGGEDEQRYYRYAVARLGAFSNVNWDLGDDLDSFRDEVWTHDTGTRLMQWDGYRHLATSHPARSNDHQDRASEWFGFTSFQEWHRPQHGWMLQQRATQAKTGRIIPQVNEEYGYEDHYPDWNPTPAPGCSADGNRRTAWEFAMSGTYQTTGETAKRVNAGGYLSGRADATMLLLEMQSHMVDFFQNFPWWTADPHDELVDHGAFCLARPGEVYAVYLPRGGRATVKLAPGRYDAHWFHCRDGVVSRIGRVTGPTWTCPKAPDLDDWAILLKKVDD